MSWVTGIFPRIENISVIGGARLLKASFIIHWMFSCIITISCIKWDWIPKTPLRKNVHIRSLNTNQENSEYGHFLRNGVSYRVLKMPLSFWVKHSSKEIMWPHLLKKSLMESTIFVQRNWYFMIDSSVSFFIKNSSKMFILIMQRAFGKLFCKALSCNCTTSVCCLKNT